MRLSAEVEAPQHFYAALYCTALPMLIDPENRNERSRVVRRRADEADQGLEGRVRPGTRPRPRLASGTPVQRRGGGVQPVAPDRSWLQGANAALLNDLEWQQYLSPGAWVDRL